MGVPKEVSKRDELLQVDGIGRNVLERRIVALVDLVYGVETRLQGRVDNSVRTGELHPDPLARQVALVRERAYRTALADFHELLASVP